MNTMNWTLLKLSMTSLLCFSLFAGVASTARAEDAKTPSKYTTKELMDQFLNQLTALKPYLVSEEKFIDPKNNTEIAGHLKEFATLAQQTAHDPMLARDNYKFSRSVLEEYITDTERVFRLGNKSYARWKLASTLSVCMSCHTQMPTGSRTFGEFESLKAFTSEFDQAEFLFATRAFDKAFVIYNKMIDGFPANKATISQVQTSLERQLNYFGRIQRKPDEAIAAMKAHQLNTKLPEPLRASIKNWLRGLEKWSKIKIPNPSDASDKDIVSFAQNNIDLKQKIRSLDVDQPYLINHLFVSGVLYEFLQKHPESKAIPEVLYWLSVCDRTMNNTFSFSLADLYLKECIVKYPTHPIAKKCYSEFEAATLAGYTGSSGTHLPPEVKSELSQLKKLVEPTKKPTHP